MPKKIIVDTNVLMAIGQYKVDIFGEIDRVCDFSYGAVVIDKVVDELENIALTQKGKHRESANLALGIIKKKKIPVLTTGGGSTDDCILHEAKSLKGIVATQDAELKKRLKSEKIPILVIRGRKYMSLIE